MHHFEEDPVTQLSNISTAIVTITYPQAFLATFPLAHNFLFLDPTASKLNTTLIKKAIHVEGLTVEEERPWHGFLP